MKNQTRVTEFIFSSFTSDPQLEIFFFFLLLLVYLLTLMGNIIIITITLLDHRLHMPMYFFLRNYSSSEIVFTLALIPKMLVNLLVNKKTISFSGCFIQFFFYLFPGTTEFFLLAVMSLDRCVAVSIPLRYATIMNSSVCWQLVLGSWLLSFFLTFPATIMTSQLVFCGPNIINHFFCDFNPLLQLSCSDTQFMQLFILGSAIISLLGTLAVSIICYGYIIRTVMRIPSTTGRKKAFSTCSAHLMVVTILYGSCIFTYVRPAQSTLTDLDKAVAVLNTVVIPLFNPFIYSLRNKQVKEAIRDSHARLSSKDFRL
ncbi:olfactory receptor 6C75-like [Alligator mississippiensis]|uniref:olfactory receptor 6C75-like n=1 Tax=Alligator mississippiensis TaxID=8496 RepID=UPI002877B077|nr:olfactory receptor 6C75-like [Alligator mississippiensis]